MNRAVAGIAFIHERATRAAFGAASQVCAEGLASGLSQMQACIYKQKFSCHVP